MNLEKMTDDELRAMSSRMQAELENRIRQRRQTAMEEIKRIAAEHHISVSIDARGRAGKATASRRAGERYVHPDDPTKVYVVGQGRPPAWFAELRASGKLPQAAHGDRAQ